MAERIYFAARSNKDIGQYLVGKLQECSGDRDKLGVSDQEASAYRHYYGVELGDGITYGVQRDGDQGELAAVRMNVARSYARAQKAIVIGPQISWRCSARNSDEGAQKATTTGQHLLEDCWKSKRLARVDDIWVEQSIAFGQAFVFPEWCRMSGELIAAEEPSAELPNGRMVYAGDIQFHNILPWDFFKDAKRRSHHALDWKYVRLQKNRWNLAKVYTTLADGTPSLDAILGAEDPLKEGSNDEDTCNVYYFFHEPCPALPKGREVILLNANCVLLSRELTKTYPEVPLYRLAADEMFDTPDGWTQFWDTLAGQELIDGAHSAAATNITTAGVNILVKDKGTEFDTGNFTPGMKVMTKAPGSQPPSALNLSSMPKELVEYPERIATQMRQVMGLNDMALGQPQTAQMNAEAFQLLAAIAVQNAGSIQGARIAALSALGTGVLKILRQNVSQERKVQITGRSSKNLFSEKAWTGEDLKPFEQAVVEIGNAMEQTPVGRTAILRTLIEARAIKSADDIYQVLETGRLESALRWEKDEKLLLQAEFEALQAGENPIVHPFHDHTKHFRENASAIQNPENLKNNAVVEAVKQHCARHYVEFFALPTPPPMPGMEQVEPDYSELMLSDPLYPDRVRMMLNQPPPGVSAMAPPGMEGAPPGAPGAMPPGDAPPLPGGEVSMEELASPVPGTGPNGAPPPAMQQQNIQ